MRKLTALAGMAALILAAPMAHATTNLLSNGGFESSTFSGPFTEIHSGAHLGAWSVDSGSIDLINQLWQHAEGNYSLDLNGGSAGRISQSFGTVVGQQYNVSFSLAGNAAAGGSLKLVDAGVTGVHTFTFDSTGRSHSNMGWVTQGFSFIATAANSTLYFQGSSQNGAWGAALDNVSVTAVPEPTTYAMLAAGLGLMGLIARRRRAPGA
ncbi:choice-of-anchor C family protein [Janthinobacterium sp. GW460P]|uniref:choice-of-anchor C family protein n=1 Tax=unclassified Janthinobacterium TaxID=2610881 RepID=UPI003FA55918